MNLEILIGNRLISVNTLHALALGCRDGSDLVDRLCQRDHQMKHDDHMAVLKWYHHWSLFGGSNRAERF